MHYQGCREQVLFPLGVSQADARASAREAHMNVPLALPRISGVASGDLDPPEGQTPMETAQQVLLDTVDRLSTEKGLDPTRFTLHDKFVLAAQYVQQWGVYEHEHRLVAAELATALHTSPQIPLAELAATARDVLEAAS